MYVLGQSSVFAAVVLMVFASFWVLDFDPLNLLGLDRAIQWGGPAAIDPRSAPKYIIDRSIVTGIAAAILSIALFSIFRRIVIALSKARIAERDHPRETKPFLEPNGEELIEFPRADGVSVVVANIGQRISLLQRRANQIYWTILGTLIVGVVLLIFAGSLSSIDSTSTTILNSVYSQRLDALQNLQRLQDFARREVSVFRRCGANQRFGQSLRQQSFCCRDWASPDPIRHCGLHLRQGPGCRSEIGR